MELNKQIKELEERIRVVFASRPYPGDDDLVMTDSLVDSDARDLLKAAKGRSWQEAAPYILTVPLADSIWFFTDAAYRYYLPAYLTALLHFEGNDRLGEAIIGSLNPFPGYENFNEKFNGLTENESKIVTQVLKFVNERVPDFGEEALNSYWNNYEEGGVPN